MQESLAYDQGLSWRWLAIPGWCLAGIAVAIMVGMLVGWFESLFDKILIIYYIIPVVCCALMISIFLLKARVGIGILGLAMAVLIMFGFLGGYEIPGYFQFRQAANQDLHLTANNEKIDPASVDFEGVIDRLILKNTGLPGFLGFLAIRAQKTPTDFFIRILVGIGIAIFTWRWFSTRPYCKECREFYPGAKMTGGLLAGEYPEFKRLIDTGNYYAAGQILREDVSDLPYVLVYLQCCAKPREHASNLMADYFDRMEGSGKVGTRSLIRAKITSPQWENLTNGFAQRPQTGA